MFTRTIRLTMKIPPGIAFFAANARQLLLPPALLAACFKLADVYLDISTPTWLQVLSLLASLPAGFAARMYLRWFMLLREARLAGAVLVPTVKSRVPGGFDLLRKFRRGERTSYIGE